MKLKHLPIVYIHIPKCGLGLPKAIQREITYRALDDPAREDFVEGLFSIIETRMGQFSPVFVGGEKWDNRHG